MAIFPIANVQMQGLAVAVPQQKASNADFNTLPESERESFIKTTGIAHRRIAPKGMKASDLCYESARSLIEYLGWKKEEVEALIFVSQTPDYRIPCTSTILQDRLGLAKTCLSFDINLGCSGYVYGLASLSQYLASGYLKKGLLLVGDISSSCVSPQDKSIAPLFSDAGSATALEHCPGELSWFNLQSDGQGFEAIMIPDGGMTSPSTKESFEVEELGPGILRSKLHLGINGLQVFNFSAKEIPPNIQQLLKHAGQAIEEVDYAVFHQANLLLNETLRRKLKLSSQKVPYSLYDFGNTSSASIPLTLITQLSKPLKTQTLTLLLSGFGVGLSWGSALVQVQNLNCLPLIEI